MIAGGTGLRVTVAAALIALGGCQARDVPARKDAGTEVPAALRDEKLTQAAAPVPGTTPMAERVAVLGLLNKRNGLTRDFEIRPGEAKRLGNVVVQLRACERTPPWEQPAETGAFVRLFVAGADDAMNRVFSGWLFQKRPERNVVQHPIYDVYVKSCAMSFPGEAAPAEASAAASASSASSAPNSAAANGAGGGNEASAGTEEAPDSAQ